MKLETYRYGLKVKTAYVKLLKINKRKAIIFETNKVNAFTLGIRIFRRVRTVFHLQFWVNFC